MCADAEGGHLDPVGGRSTPPGDRSRIDEVATCFDRAWKTGPRPRIEEYLADVAEPVRTQLLEELLRVELEIRRRMGEQPTPEDYRPRFQGDAAAIDAVFDSTIVMVNTPLPNGGTGTRDVRLEPGDRVGNYELIKWLGDGGQGEVWKARWGQNENDVALKVLLPRTEQDADSIQRLTEEFKTIAGLRHPNIVRIHIFDQDHGRWYFSMELFEGGTVADQLKHYKADPRSAARLVEKVARAIHYAHNRGNKRVLHLDLKPANILLDAHGEPHISDFGLSIRLETLDPSVSSPPSREPGGTPPGGTPLYVSPEMASGMLQARSPACDMSPEMALGTLRAISPACDIYGLGAILYTMLTEEPPFRGQTVRETLRLVVAGKLVPPSKLNPEVDRLLEAICLRCLRKEPEHRYGSADALANDLRRWLNLEPPAGVEVSNFERFRLWTRRHPAGAALSTVAVVLLIASTAMAVRVAQAREAGLVREVRRSLQFEAKHVASRVLWELKTLSDPVEREANDPRLSKLMQQSDSKGLQSYVKSILDKYKPANEKEDYRIQTWYVLDGKGRLLASLPMQQSNIGKYYNWRDYFREALHHAKLAAKSRVHISRVFFSDGDQRPRLAFSAPVFADPDHSGGPLGIVVATTTTAAVLGSLSLEDGGRTVVVVGRREPNTPRDKNSPRGTLPADQSPSPSTALLPEFPTLFHPGYPHQPGVFPIEMPGKWIQAVLRPRPNDECPGNEFWLSDSAKDVDDNYRDPLGIKDSKYGGRWLAAFAPVGDTELVVVVQQKYDEAITPGLTLALDSFLWDGVAIVLIVIVVGIVGYFITRRVAGRSDHRGVSTVEN